MRSSSVGEVMAGRPIVQVHSPLQGLPAQLPTHGAHVRAGVRFADADSSSSPAPLPASASSAAPPRLDVHLGFLLLGGIYVADLLTLQNPAPDAQQQQQQDPAAPPLLEVHALAASNLSVGTEAGPAPGQHRAVLRLWADREGPFEAAFTLGIPPGRQVGGPLLPSAAVHTAEAGPARPPTHAIASQQLSAPRPCLRRWRCT